jgi:hypothetical protein
VEHPLKLVLVELDTVTLVVLVQTQMVAEAVAVDLGP